MTTAKKTIMKPTRRVSGILIRTTLFAALVATIAGIWAAHTGFIVNPDNAPLVVRRFLYALGSAVLLVAVSRVPRYRDVARTLRCREFAVALLCVPLLAIVSQVVVVFDYLCVALAPPSIEGDLVRFDSALGFHWLGLYRWVNGHPDLRSVLDLAYRSAMPQMIAVPFLLAAMRRVDDLGEFVAVYACSILVVVLVSAPFPAESAFVRFGITDPGTASTVSHYDLLRSGALRQLNLSESQGLVSLPSFHVMMAIMLAYAVRHVRYVFPASVVLNLVMIASTPTQGGHYLADVIAGVVCGILTIVAVRRWLAGGRRTAAMMEPPAARPT